jgi:hypothetical protein
MGDKETKHQGLQILSVLQSVPIFHKYSADVSINMLLIKFKKLRPEHQERRLLQGLPSAHMQHQSEYNIAWKIEQMPPTGSFPCT